MATSTPPRLVLASGSPRRRDLLAQLALQFTVRVSNIDETPRPAEPPPDYVLRLASEKAATVAQLEPGALVLAADTTVAIDGELLGKPEHDDEAKQMLRRLSGKAHQVFTGVALSGAATRSLVVRTTVRFKVLSEAEIAWYVSTGEPRDKAGAYAIQGIGGALVSGVDGSTSNVVGLPLAETLELLSQAGYPLPWSAR